MIKLSLNSPAAAKPSSATTSAPFSSALAAAVEAASLVPAAERNSSPAPTPKVKAKSSAPGTVHVSPSSTGLLSRGIKWLQGKGRSKKRLHMIETVSLGEKRFVALVKVDGREFLLGGAPSSVGMLADLGAHGLTELLNAPTVSSAGEPKIAEHSALPAPFAEFETLTPLAAAPTIEPSHEQVLPASEIEPSPFALAEAVKESLRHTATDTTKTLSVVVEADEDESDWLAQDDVAEQLRSALEMEPSPAKEQTSAGNGNVADEAAPQVQPQFAEAVVQAAVPSLGTVKALNFTFQMWPTPQASSTAAPLAGSGHVSGAPRTRIPVDLESCPELLGEPYVLSLVNTYQEAAA